MRIIHCADIHLGAKIDSFPREISEKRKQEVRSSFLRMTEYARDNAIRVIILAGDVFDRARPLSKDTEFFAGVVESNPDIDFLYLRGNHDTEGKALSYPNLKCFSDQWVCYEYENTAIQGIELNEGNSLSMYSSFAAIPGKKNIAVLHGQIGAEINLTKLRDKGIDYLALGHIHEYSCGSLDLRGVYAYSGCLEGRGFDECGDKGFIVIDTAEGLSHRFIPFSQHRIEKLMIDVSGLREGAAMARAVTDTHKLDRDGIYRVELVGEVDIDTDSFASDVEGYLADRCGYISVKDRTRRRIDHSAFESDCSIRGEFVRAVMASEHTEDEKARIIAYGLKALAGREVDQ